LSGVVARLLCPYGDRSGSPDEDEDDEEDEDERQHHAIIEAGEPVK